MNIGIVLLSRLSSKRLPGKALRTIIERPVIGHIFDRLNKYFAAEKIVLATSVEPSDDPLFEFAKFEGINCFRGSLNNVALRFLEASEINNFDYAVRITGDSLFIDPIIIKAMICEIKEKHYDMISNRKLQTYPVGQTIEILNSVSFRKFYLNFNLDEDFEHVTPYLYKNEIKENIKILHYKNPENFIRKVSLAIDTPEDLLIATKVVTGLGNQFVSSDYKKILREYEKYI